MLVASLEEGERQAQNGGLLPLSEVFTEEELAEISLEQISFDITDSDGNPEEEFSEPCGFKLTGEVEKHCYIHIALIIIPPHIAHLKQQFECRIIIRILTGKIAESNICFYKILPNLSCLLNWHSG